MKQEELKRIIGKIKKYDLVGEFSNIKEVKEWLISLNQRQINNFLNLNINISEIKVSKKFLIDKNFLNCEDYQNRIETLLNWYKENKMFILIEFAPIFLSSINFYQDLEIYAKFNNHDIANDINNLRKILCIFGSNDFINSPYHEEDLQIIIKAVKENNNNLDYLISLATHPYSINDKYHLENMKILSQNPIASEFLCKLMLSDESIDSKYYRDEINALLKAENREKAIALYIFIDNPDSFNIRTYFNESSIEFSHYLSMRFDNISGRDLPNYLEKLNFLCSLNSLHALYIGKILTNLNFINNPYYEFDIKFLLNIDNEKMLYVLSKLMTDEYFIISPHHINDLKLISQATDENIIYLLTELATDSNNINSQNHNFDMNYIAKFENIPAELYNQIEYYLFGDGINDPNYKEKLIKIANGEIIKPKDEVLDYLNELENDPTLLKASEEPKKGGILTRIRNRFKNEQ